MSIIQLPRNYNPGFKNPRINPVGNFVIDWNNPITRGLKTAWVGSSLKDLVTGGEFVIEAGSIATGRRNGIEELKVVNGRLQADVKTGISGGDDRTMFTIVSNDDAEANNYIFATGETGSGARWAVRNSTNALRFEGGAGSSTITGSPAFTLNDANFHTLAVRQKGGNTLGDANFYLDGQFGDFSGASTTNTTNDAILLCGQQASSTDVEHRSYRVVYYWNRALSDAEILVLVTNPYAFLKPAIPLQYFIPVAAGVTVALTGVAATAAVGSVGTIKSIALATVLATAQVGSVSFQESGSVSLTTVNANAEVGSVGNSRTVALTGVEATAEVGNVTPTLSVIVPLTGVQANAEVGSVDFTKSGSVQLIGVSANSATGGLGFEESGNVGITGVEATAQVGSVTPSGDVLLQLTGVQANAEVGDLGHSISIPLAGVAAVGALGDLANSTTIIVNGVEATGAVGNVDTGEPWPTDIDDVKIRSIESVQVFSRTVQVTLRSKTGKITIRSIS